MFERFTPGARQAVVLAQEVARQQGHAPGLSGEVAADLIAFLQG